MTELLGGKYVLERRLGAGGMAEVFLARTVGAEGFSRRVAIKRVLAGYSENEQFSRMFVAEAKLTSRLQHPNIVSVLDFDRDAERRLFLVMELIDGTDLDGLLATGPLPLPAIVHVVCEILRALAYAHDLPLGGDDVRGIVHRDISPHNVLLSWEGATKVSDFGIAKARAASDASASAFVKGKPRYMSPEQANGSPVDGRSDLFAVGVMLWEMLCGQPLFAADSMEAMLARVFFAPIPQPREWRPDVPPDLDRIVTRLLARDRAERFPAAEAALAELVACTSYPRDGRDLLVALLAERFPGRAPARARGVVTASPADPTRVPVATPTRPATPLPNPVPPGTANGGTTPAPAATPRRGLHLAAVLVAVAATVAVAVALAVTLFGARRDADHRPDVPPAPRAPEREDATAGTVPARAPEPRDASPAPTGAIDASTANPARTPTRATGAPPRPADRGRPRRPPRPSGSSKHPGSGIREITIGR